MRSLESKAQEIGTELEKQFSTFYVKATPTKDREQKGRLLTKEGSQGSIL